MITSPISNSNSKRKPDYANLEQNLILLEKKKNKEISINSDIASLIAYQQMLCSHLGIVHTNLSNVVPQIRRPFPSLPFSNLPISMPQTSQNIKLLIEITKLLWATIASKSDSAEIFINVHKKFNTMILTRNKFILMNPGPRLNATFKESNEKQPDEDNKADDTFSKAFNLTIQKNEKLDNTFLPTKSDLQELEDKIGDQPTEEKLRSFYEDLSITEKELYNYISDITKTQFTGNYFTQFPDSSIIQELPSFTEALNSIGRNTVFVRSELYEYSKTISNTLHCLNDVFEKFQNCFSLPQIRFDITQHLINIESQHYTAMRKVNFFKSIIKNAKMKPPHEWNSVKFLEDEFHFYEVMKQLFANNRLDEISDLINTRLETIAKNDIQEEITNEIKAAHDSKIVADTASNEWLEKSTKANNIDNQKLLKSYREAQKETEEKEIRNNQIRDEVYTNLTNTIGRARQLIYRLSDAPVIPPTFEMKMNKLIEKDAKIEALKIKAMALQKDLQKKKDEIEELKRKSTTLDKQLKQKKDEFEGYKQKSANNKNVIVDAAKSLEEFDKFEDLYVCYFHRKEKRERFLKGCKHSFCQRCIQTQIKERNRRCPYCHEPFKYPYDIIDINWEKPHK